MHGKFEELSDRFGSTHDRPTTVGQQLASIFDVEFARSLPDHVDRLLNQINQARRLSAGRNDDFAGPLAAGELIAGIEALLRQPPESRDTVVRVGPLELDLIERTAKRGDRTIDLLPREFRLLEYMMRRKEQILTRALLLEEVWNYKFARQTNLVDVHMGRLRRKVDKSHEPPMIYNVRGTGFILRAPA
jgi:two-component system OmpR family response regulator